MAVQFSYSEINQDFLAFAAGEAKFLDASGPNKIKDAAAKLMRLSDSNQEAKWAIADQPHAWVRTRLSAGECELGDNVAWQLVGAMCFDWTIARTKAGKKSRFKIINATTKLRLLVSDGDHGTDDASPVAVWRFEIGSDGHPGTNFHSQIEWQQYYQQGTLEVPRLPSIVITPIECLDFLLGSCFKRHGRRARSATQSARSGGTTSDVGFSN